MKRDIVVIGGSAGAVEALRDVVAQLPADLKASVFAVIHIPADAVSLLPRILSRRSNLTVRHPADGDKIERGVVYVAPPNYHLVLNNGRVNLVHGPRENGHRPAIDPLFRSAAIEHGTRVIGVVLSGNLNDGTAGLFAIKRAGGLAMTQDPNDALYPAMPRSAAAAATADVTGTAVELGRAIAEQVSEKVTQEDPVTAGDIRKEERISELQPAQLHGDDQPGTPSGLTCPECSGSLWELEDAGVLRFRCRVGHAYTMETLIAEEGRALENAFWVALRALEENATIARRGRERATSLGHSRTAERLNGRERELLASAEQIRKLLLSGALDMTGVTNVTEG